jgi:hypothetical protein
MGWPQWVYLGCLLLSLGAVLAKHGQQRAGGTYNFWYSLAVDVLMLCLLYAGGFFAPVHAQVPEAAAQHRLTLVREAHGQWGLTAPVAALAAQVHQESGWRADAVSRVGAKGMAQFMPSTAKWWCELTGTTPDDCLPHNPTWALRSLVGYDLFLFKRAPVYMGDYDRLWLALRGYNGGEGNWQAEARGTGLRQPTRPQIDAACGRAKRAALHCPENLGYPRRILVDLQPRYAGWGVVWRPSK